MYFIVVSMSSCPISCWSTGSGTTFADSMVDDAAGVGLQLVLEYRLVDWLAADLRPGGFWTELGRPAEINYPAGSGDYALASAELQVDLARRRRTAVG